MMDRAIDRLFKRLAATYGAAWDRSLGETPVADVKTVWAHELAPFENSMHRIAWALENLPDRCPNVLEFKRLCRSAPSPDVPALPEPKADPARVAAELAKLQVIVPRGEAPRSPEKDWAKRILQRAKDGCVVNATSLRMARDALGVA